MKKLNALFGTLAVLLAGSGVANAAGPATAQLHVHGTIVSDTCTFVFPTTAPVLNVNAADYSSATVGGDIGNAVNLGNITASGCNTNNVTLQAQSDAQITGNVERGKFTYTNKPADAKDPLAFTVGYGAVGGATAGLLKLDNSAPVTFTADAASFNIPVTLQVLKQDAVDNIGAYAGDFTATVTYTADFS
ncbi:TPA: type 1 fimbrial protein [Salmonella enterica]|uniref:Type 1 fimbrial protein n=1 Tax=Salmonella enterica subsp. diarizonae serovar Rough:r:z TaxID=1974321 RepID=A0A7Z1BMP9_SALDZ|nr:type 1 fimbrial protein [Salmonella enterica]EEJ6656771.1 type 1 fimbrial protein [Salmonella enterica subsp. enterica serovar Redlands]EAM2983013.1 type 1 fimbrial protein [Salmonella enterica]EBS7185399.1 type 1 fimbrial protein [Salmonella enterica]EFS2572297.1 type 1 fimbrial protein [Salmonella enterica]EKT0971478.1 type 1 fimbrial protein [Salmonella enterica]